MAEGMDARRVQALIRETNRRLELLIARLSVEEMNGPDGPGAAWRCISLSSSRYE